MEKAILRLAAELDRKYQRDYASYLEECESYYRDGYRPARCEHGTNQWTDYDNICGPCEDGLTMSDGLFRMAYAISVAKDRVARSMEILAWMTKARELGMSDFVDTDKVIEEFARLRTVN